MPTKMLQDLFNLSADHVVELRNTLLGIANTKYDYGKRG
jgi:hypothetical protein